MGKGENDHQGYEPSDAGEDFLFDKGALLRINRDEHVTIEKDMKFFLDFSECGNSGQFTSSTTYNEAGALDVNPLCDFKEMLDEEDPGEGNSNNTGTGTRVTPTGIPDSVVPYCKALAVYVDNLSCRTNNSVIGQLQSCTETSPTNIAKLIHLQSLMPSNQSLASFEGSSLYSENLSTWVISYIHLHLY